MKTTVTKTTDIKRDWHLVDLDQANLGRSMTSVAKLLIGKGKPYFTPAMDCGDYVVIINAAKVEVTGAKRTDKLYQHHTGFPGGFRETNFEKLMAKDPRQVIEHAIKGMLPKNKLRADRLKRLKIYVGSEHPYSDQVVKSENQ